MEHLLLPIINDFNNLKCDRTKVIKVKWKGMQSYIVNKFTRHLGPNPS